MKILNNYELMEINGGGFKLSIGFAILAGIVFIIGVIDGIIRPLKCN